jgi:hypothetical protein
MEIDYRQTKARTTLEKREHWRKKQQLKDLRSEHDKESKQKKLLKLEVRMAADLKSVLPIKKYLIRIFSTRGTIRNLEMISGRDILLPENVSYKPCRY